MLPEPKSTSSHHRTRRVGSSVGPKSWFGLAVFLSASGSIHTYFVCMYEVFDTPGVEQQRPRKVNNLTPLGTYVSTPVGRKKQKRTLASPLTTHVLGFRKVADFSRYPKAVWAAIHQIQYEEFGINEGFHKVANIESWKSPSNWQRFISLVRMTLWWHLFSNLSWATKIR